MFTSFFPDLCFAYNEPPSLEFVCNYQLITLDKCSVLSYDLNFKQIEILDLSHCLAPTPVLSSCTLFNVLSNSETLFCHQVTGIPVVFVSALEGKGRIAVMRHVIDTYEKWCLRLSTARLNRWLRKVCFFPSRIIKIIHWFSMLIVNFSSCPLCFIIYFRDLLLLVSHGSLLDQWKVNPLVQIMARV